MDSIVIARSEGDSSLCSEQAAQSHKKEKNKMPSEGKYIYCIINAQEERDFGSIGIGGRGDKVHSVLFEDIAAVLSDSPVVKYSISRENTMAHMKVMEKLMNDYTVLPVKFGTVAEVKDGVDVIQRIKLEILKDRYEELKSLLARMNNKVELGLKALWINMETIFQEIVDENRDIKILKKRIISRNPAQTHSQRMNLGEMVKKALDAKKAKEEAEILKTLKSVYCDLYRNKVFGDSMVTNSAFLVDKRQIEEFDHLIEKLESTYNERTKFKYVGPVPPCNFVELVITLKGEKSGEKA